MYAVDSRVRLIQVRNTMSSCRWARRVRRFSYIIKQVCSLYRSEQYDTIVNVLYYNWLELRVATWLVGAKIPIVMTDHFACEFPDYMTMSRRIKLKKFFWSRLFDSVTVLTKADLKIMQDKGVKQAQVLHNPLFLTPSTDSIPRKQKMILTMGRLKDWHVKGLDLLIEAWNKVSPKHPDWKLKIVGKGRDETLAMLRGLCKYPETVEFVPFTSNPKALYEEASIYVLSSRYEGWGLVMVEAMSQGCATIACDFRGRQAEAITDGVNGLLCETDSADAIAEKIKLLIEDDGLRHRLQLAAPQSVERFSEANVAKHLENIIETIRNKK
jgi:glycosyltransferase involved in cell wall biosynthesis